MSVDVETQLRRLGRHLEREVAHVEVDEIVEDRPTMPLFASSLSGSTTARPDDRRRPRRLVTTAVAAGLLAVLIGGLAVVDRDRRDGTAPSDRPAVCRGEVELISFDAAIFPSGGVDAALAGDDSTPEATVGSYLADRVSGAARHGLDVGFAIEGIVDGHVGAELESIVIVRASLSTGDATGTVDVALRRVESGPRSRWIVQAAASVPDEFSQLQLLDGIVTGTLDLGADVVAHVAVHDVRTGRQIDASTLRTEPGSEAQANFELVAGGSQLPVLQAWLIDETALGRSAIRFTELQLNAGSPDFGEGWHALQRNALC